ncbi:MAG: alpha/beta hydrolase domain-containing protein, partial [Geminicoccaceae bacterium]
MLRGSAAALGIALCLTPAQARVTRIVVDQTTSPAFNGQAFGTAGAYETLSGRAFGELDPSDPHNAIIQDINLAPRNASGRVEYMATFFLVKPIDMSRSSHVMWEDVPNRGGRITLATFDRNNGDVGLSAGWQGDNVGATQQVFPNTTRDFVVVPVAKNPDGSSITGMTLGRIYNVSGPASQAPLIYTNPTPYPAATLDTTQARLIARTAESMTGEVSGERLIASGDWAWARCTAASPFPGTPDPTQVCLRDGFDPGLIYTVVFPAKDPYVLGIGFASFRDLGSFFRYAQTDDFGTPNPLAGGITASIARGSSQSGNFLREYIQLGFTQDEANRKVHDASWPTIAGRRLVMNVRFATPDAVLHLYQAGSEGPMWWVPWPDVARGLPAAGILDRCSA